jgi:hypothetical protein
MPSKGDKTVHFVHLNCSRCEQADLLILVPFPIILLLSHETYKYFRLKKLNLTDE